MFESLVLSELSEKNHRILRPPSNTRPTIWLVEEKGTQAVVKDFSSTGRLYKNTAGRFLIWREKRAYNRLRGLHGIPSMYRVIDGLAIVLEQIPGRNLEKLERQKRLPESFFDDLEDLITAFHKRGLAHCDLKRAPNILLGPGSTPYIVDWAASVSRKELGPYPLNLIYERFLLDDYKAVTKLKLRHVPESISEAELSRYSNRSLPERLIRAIRDRLRKILKKIA